MIFDPKLEIISGERHRSLLEETYRFAKVNSQDNRTNVGALIVNLTLQERLAYGANHFPARLEVTSEKSADRDWKYKHMIHAEIAAVTAAAREGKSTENSIMYMPWVPCTPCAITLVDAGIKQLIGHKAMIEKTPERWWESTQYALNLLEKCGVRTSMYDGTIGGIENLFDGVVWKP